MLCQCWPAVYDICPTLTRHLVLFPPAPGFLLDTQALHCLLDLSGTSRTYFLDVLCRAADNLLTGADHTQPLQQETEARKNTHHKSQTSPLQGNYSININRQIIQFEFSPAWSCVSLTRSTTSREWKLFRFYEMEINYFQILLIDDTFYFQHV